MVPIIKGKGTYCEPYPCSADSFQVPIKGAVTDISSISSKIVDDEFRCRKVIPPTSRIKHKNEYPNLSVDWEKIYSLALSVNLKTNLRAFQYKLMNRIVYTNDRLYKFKIVAVSLKRNPSSICDPPWENREKGERTRTARSYVLTKDVCLNTVAPCKPLSSLSFKCNKI